MTASIFEAATTISSCPGSLTYMMKEDILRIPNNCESLQFFIFAAFTSMVVGNKGLFLDMFGLLGYNK